MAGDRTVKVTLSAQVQGYIDGMARAAKATKEVGSESEKLAQQREAFNQVGVAALGMGTLAAAGVALAVSKWSDFDAAMSNVQAATRESTEGMKALSDAALDAGARTVFSAEESANAIEELAKAGVSTADILNGALDGALDLAAAGGLGVADAAGIAATALKTFNLEGGDMGHVADLMAAGAGKAMGDVTDLSGALNQSAMVANATGLSIEETTATLAAFASQGLLGSDAGTSFKSMLQSLTPSSAAARDTMNELGISAYDAQGNFIGMSEFAGVLQNGLKDLSVEQQQSALKTIFGSDAIRAATVLYSEGADGINEWIDAVDDQGYAAEQAAARLDNLKGDLEALGGALDTALIKTGSAANDVLRGMVGFLTETVDAYNELPAPLQGATLAAGILTAAVGLLGGGMMLAVPQIAAYKTALVTLGIEKSKLVTVTGALTKAMGAAGLGLAIGQGAKALLDWGARVSGAAAQADELVKKLTEAKDVSSDLARTLTGSQFDFGKDWNTGVAVGNLKALDSAVGGLQSSFEATDFGGLMTKISTFGLGGQLGQTKKNIEELDDALAQMVASGQGERAAEVQAQFAATAAEAGWSAEKAADALPGYTTALEGVVPAADSASASTLSTADAFQVQNDKATSLVDEVNQLIDVLNELNNIGQGAEQTNAALQSSYATMQEYVANAQAGVEGYSLSLDWSTESGSANRAMLADHAAAVVKDAEAQFDLEVRTLGAEQATANFQNRLNGGRQAIYDTALALTGNAEEAQALTDKILAMPDQKAVDVLLNGAQEAEAQLAWVSRRREALVQIRTEGGAGSGALNWNPSGTVDAGANGFIEAYANGGFASGIYKGGAPIHKFAEPETRWEAYISGKPGQEDRNRQIWVEAGNRLGATQDMVRSIVAELGGGRGGNTVKVDVHPGPGVSEAEIGRVAAAKADWILRGQG